LPDFTPSITPKKEFYTVLVTEPALTPQLKDFIDRVIVPLLVREYLAAKKQIAQNTEAVASCELMTDTPDVEACR
jgi:hypothetical protein